MAYFDYVIVGSGPAGVAAARRLAAHNLCIVDVGQTAETQFPYQTMGDALAAADTRALLGNHWEMLGNLMGETMAHSKLRAPCIAYVAKGEPAFISGGQGTSPISVAGSYAAGGLSNAWGGQLVRYRPADLALAGDWPIEVGALDPHYVDLEAHIGISGENDDMSEFFGHVNALQPPAPLVPAAQRLLANYRRRQSRSSMDLRLGYSRLGLLTQAHRGHEPHRLGQTEFFTTEQEGFYTARRTLRELRSQSGVTYLGGCRLLAYQESDEHVELVMQESSGVLQRITARHLLLACGTLHTARLVLLNRNEQGRQLPFIEHPPTLFPLFMPSMFGTPLPQKSFPVQLAATLAASDSREMISIYYPGAMLRADLAADMPLSYKASLRLLPKMLGGLLVGQVWQTARAHAGNTLTLVDDGSIRINFCHREHFNKLPHLLSEFRRIGAFSLSRLATTSPPGWGFHYAGCLPMRASPQAYETHVDGRLWDSRRVRVVDASVLPSLPAKNLSLTMMANAARIAEETLRCGY